MHARMPAFARVPTRLSPPSSALQHVSGYSEDPAIPPSFLSRAMKSVNVPESDPDALVSLPFRLDIQMTWGGYSTPAAKLGWG